MRRRSRTGRVVKWVGITGCALFALAWVASLFWSVTYIGGGQAFWTGPGVVNIRRRVGWLAQTSGWFFSRTADSRVDSWLPRTKRIGASRESRLVVPLWIPFVVVVIPTALLWYFDRRRFPPGHCQDCGYDLRGNVSGRCPECGLPIEHEGEKA
jgi:hypothetical protein